MMRPIVLLVLALALGQPLQAQPAFPFSLGAQLELGDGYFHPYNQEGGLGRISPFVSLYLSSLGILKFAYTMNNTTVVDSLGEDQSREFKSWTVQAGGTLGGTGRPYAFVSYTDSEVLTSSGDTKWQEWGSGIGAGWQVSPWITITIEVEHRWIGDHVIPWDETSISEARRWQMNTAVIVFLI